ncbi:MAG: plasmid pRiA4b ORF-3 family protein [Polyangiaceae bacterium]|nr:plasmid pRiA4b ORF-3 family protein [Polyangiaceae bacterium]
MSQGGTNGAALVRAIQAIDAKHREAADFLLTHMPEHDLRELSPALFTENLVLAEEAFAAAPWRAKIPREVYLNDILPYASVNERRDNWRRLLREKCAPLGGIANEGSTFLYRYDFGDDWEHEIRVERVVKGDGKDIVCTGGARACPPEDCGGSSGYAGLLKVLADKEHGEHARMRQWVGGGFNPEMFDMEGVNKGLASLSRRRGRRAKK